MRNQQEQDRARERRGEAGTAEKWELLVLKGNSVSDQWLVVGFVGRAHVPAAL